MEKEASMLQSFMAHLCLDTGTCNIGDDSDFYKLLMVAFNSRKSHLQDFDCDAAEVILNDTEHYLQTILVDIVA